MIRLTQKTLPDNKQHSQQTGIHARGGIINRNSSKPGAADLRLRPRVHWDRLGHIIRTEYYLLTDFFYVLEILPTETVRKDMVTKS